MKRVLIAAAVSAVVLLMPGALIALVAGAQEAPPGVSISVSPEDLELASGSTRVVTITVSNTGDEAVRTFALPIQHDPGLAYVTTRHLPVSVAGGTSASATLAVSKSAETAAKASMAVIYEFESGPANAPVRSSVTGAITVSAPAEPATPPRGPLAVTTTLGSDTLVQYKSVDVFFVISNSSNRAQLIKRADATFPSSLNAEQLGIGEGAADAKEGRLALELGLEDDSLAPGDTAVVHLELSSESPLQPGEAVVALAVRSEDSLDHRTATSLSTTALKLEVLGESGFLEIVGVPSLLFLPGFVTIVVLSLLWGVRAPFGSFKISADGPVEKKIAVGILSMLPSGVIAFVYPPVTEWALHTRRDYRRSYGFEDIFYAWTLGAALAVGLYLASHLLVLVPNLVKWTADWLRRSLFIPSRDDSPRDVLIKIARRPWNRALRRPALILDGEDRVFAFGRSRNGKIVVTPEIKWTFHDEGDASLAQTVNEAITRMIEKRQAVRLYRFLDRQRAYINLEFDPDSPVEHPTWVEQVRLGNPEEYPILTPVPEQRSRAGGGKSRGTKATRPHKASPRRQLATGTSG